MASSCMVCGKENIPPSKLQQHINRCLDSSSSSSRKRPKPSKPSHPLLKKLMQRPAKKPKNSVKSPATVSCPVCGKKVAAFVINSHLDEQCGKPPKFKAPASKRDDTSKFHVGEPKGLFLIEDFISAETERRLLAFFETQNWQPFFDGTPRRFINYGPRLSKNYKVVQSQSKFGPLPAIISDVLQRMHSFVDTLDCKTPKLSQKIRFDQLFVNEFNRHNELRLHFDERGAFEEPLFGISLGARSTMRFRHGKHHHRVVDLVLPRCSAYCMTGDARFGWEHGFIKGSIEGRRVSMTFRAVREVFRPAQTVKHSETIRFSGEQS